MSPREEIPACRVCGCTNDRACEGGCWWVEPDLCSTCKQAMPDTPPDLATAARALLRVCAELTAEGMVDDDACRRAMCGVDAALAALSDGQPPAPRDLPLLREADDAHVPAMVATP